MRRIRAMSLAIGAFLALGGCATDNEPPKPAPVVDASPPPAPAETATPETVAWADEAVTHALAAEKKARDAGGADAKVKSAIQYAIMEDVQDLVFHGSDMGQANAGLGLALNNPRNTPATHEAFGAALAEIKVKGVGVGGCPECKDTSGPH